jgi:hypothetical protein
MNNKIADVIVTPIVDPFPAIQQNNVTLAGYTKDGIFVGLCTVPAERTTRAVFVKDYRYVLTYNSYSVDDLEVCRTILNCDFRPSKVMCRVLPTFSNSVHALRVYRKHQILIFNRYYKEDVA